jgi:putative ABC transport system permease protein
LFCFVWTFARKILLHDRIKFAVASAGVSISVLLVLVQIGLYFGFMQSASDLVDHADADIWVTAEANDNFDFAAPMDERVVYRVAEEPGVARVERVILGFGQIKGEAGDAQGVQVIGLEPHGTMLKPWNIVKGNADDIARGDAILVDITEYQKLHISDIGAEREITQARARVVAMSTGIRSFTTSPYVWTNLHSARTYTRLNSTQLTYVLVKAAPGVDPNELVQRLNRLPNVDAYTKARMSIRTRNYWSSRTGVGVGFLTTAIIGVVVGIVVVGQILYSGTLEHLKEYGTLKAMGAANFEIVRVIIYQAVLSAGVGFALGGVLAIVARAAMHTANLRVVLSPELVGGTAVLTVVMCVTAALLSITKVLRLDPASVFEG